MAHTRKNPRRQYTRPASQYPPWTGPEERLVAKLYYTVPVKEIALQLGRTKDAVRARANKLGVSRPHGPQWTQKELDFLRKYFPSKGKEFVAKALKSRPRRIEDKAIALGLVFTKHVKKMMHQPIYKRLEMHPELYLWKRYKRPPIVPGVRKPWSKEEIEFLTKNYKTMRFRGIAERLQRTPLAVTHMVSNIGLKKRRMHFWTNAELKKLKKLRLTHSDRELGVIFGVSEWAINGASQRMGTEAPRIPRWTEKETKYLLKHYHFKTHEVLAQELGRSKTAIIENSMKYDIPARAVQPPAGTKKKILPKLTRAQKLIKKKSQ